MARPEPTVILQHNRDDGIGVVQVCEAQADGLFAVLYQGKPFQLRNKANIEVREPGWKYMRMAFANSGHAFNLAQRLNLMFATQDFTVKKMTQGTTIPVK